MPPNSEQGNGGPADPARPLPPRFWGGERKLFLEDGMLNTWRHDREGLGVVHDDGGNDLGCRADVGASVGLPAGELAVMPDDMSRNRNVDRENGARAGTERSTQACCTADRQILGKFRLGAGLRHRNPRDSSVSNPTRMLSALRSPRRPARWEVVGALALLALIAVAHARDGVGPVLGGVPCPRVWLDSVDRHARTAIAPRQLGRSGYNNELGAKVAGTSVHSL